MAKSPDPVTSAYVDTAAFIAFADRSDSHHALFRRLFSDPPRLLTTALVVSEGHAWFLRRFDRQRALGFLAMVEALRPLEILSVGPKEHRAGLAVLRKYSDQDLTMTDAIGLHFLGARRIKVCWSTDRHLSLTGVPLAIHLN